ncbi:MAG TPA: hypothetical protein VI653_08980 [Steroidobacteraceae bacterium]
MRKVLLVTALLVVAPYGWAQQAPPAAPSHDAPSPADLEPGVNTSAPAPVDTAPPPAASAPKSAVASKPAAASKAAPGSSAQSKTDMASKTDTQPADAKPAADTRAAKNGAASGKKGDGKAEDHLQLDTTQITGNQELPKVLYIVPWKRSDLGDLLGRPANSLLDEVLQPVDRDVFKRENRYYDALKPDAAAVGKAGAGAGQTSGDKH